MTNNLPSILAYPEKFQDGENQSQFARWRSLNGWSSTALRFASTDSTLDWQGYQQPNSSGNIWVSHHYFPPNITGAFNAIVRSDPGDVTYEKIQQWHLPLRRFRFKLMGRSSEAVADYTQSSIVCFAIVAVHAYLFTITVSDWTTIFNFKNR